MPQRLLGYKRACQVLLLEVIPARPFGVGPVALVLCGLSLGQGAHWMDKTGNLVCGKGREEGVQGKFQFWFCFLFPFTKWSQLPVLLTVLWFARGLPSM